MTRFPIWPPVQLSAVAFKLDGTQLGEFNSYVKPAEGSIWNPMAMEVTGLGPRDPRITSAKPLEAVWPDFKGFVENLLQNESQKGVMVAWGGKGCDAEWIFRVTKVEHPETLQMPKGLEMWIQIQ